MASRCIIWKRNTFDDPTPRTGAWVASGGVFSPWAGNNWAANFWLMNEKRWPFIQWFVSDWLGDPKVSLCEPATRGILFDWLCNMHALDRTGQLTGSRETLARLGRCSDRQCAAALADLSRTNAAEISERNGLVTVVNRRMKREYLSRKAAGDRVKRHRCNGGVTGHTKDPEPEAKGQDSQGSRARDGAVLTKLTGNWEGNGTLGREALDRVAAEIVSNRHGWSYDNCRVQPRDFPVRRSLVTELEKWVGRLPEEAVHGAWREAARRAHQAAVDGLVKGSVAGYCIACWREAMEKILKTKTENLKI